MAEELVRRLISRIRRSKRLLHRFDDEDTESGSAASSDNEGWMNTLDYASEEIQGVITPSHLMRNQGHADVVRGTWTTRRNGVKYEVIIKAWPLRPKARQIGDKDAVTDASTVRMVREARTWLSLKHLNIMPLHGWRIEGPWNDSPCIIMPYMRNGDLASYVIRSKPKPSNAERLELLIQVADALLYIHTPPFKTSKREKDSAPISIVHGDVKASNVLLSDGIPKRALLGDFGAARIADGPGGRTGLTTSSQDGGTAGYKAPERYGTNGEKHEGYIPIAASDVYSFGGLNLEVLSGVAPFQGKERADYLVTAAVLERKTSPRDEHQLLHPRATVWDLMERCWTFEPDGRPGMLLVLESLKAEYAYVTRHDNCLQVRT